jgi:hypothetical protein
MYICIYIYIYIYTGGAISGKNESRRKALSLTNMWNLLKDFDICPQICNKIDFLDSVAAVIGDTSLNSSFSNTQTIADMDLLLSYDR